MRASEPMPLRTCSMSASTASHRLARSFMNEMRVASIALAANLTISALAQLITIAGTLVRVGAGELSAGAFGALIASFVGTMGASVLLVRPLLRANSPRQRRAHVVVFFIFIVSNCGGLLTPLGDPPLFLGFLAVTALLAAGLLRLFRAGFAPKAP